MNSSTLNEGYIKGLIKWCGNNDVKLIMGDSLVRLQDGDENSARDSAKFFRLVRMLTSEGITVLLAHHNTKSANGSQYRGSSDIQASVDCQLSLVRVDDGDKLLLEQVKNRRARELPRLELSFVDYGDYSEFTYLGDAQSSDKYASTKRAVLKILVNKQGISQSGIQEELERADCSVNIKTLRVVLSNMELTDESITKARGKANSYRYYIHEEDGDELNSQVKG